MEIALQLIGGLTLLALGGEGVVRGAVGVARRLGLSELLIGLVLVGFGTSAPELITSIKAALSGAPSIAVGNVVGSNISNVLLVLAVVAIVRPIAVHPAAVRRDGLIMIGVSVLLAVLLLMLGELSRLVGAVLVGLLVAYILLAWWLERRGGQAAAVHEGEAHTHDPPPPSLWLSLGFAGVGLAGLVFGADLLVAGAVTLARIAGLSETTIGLTIVAVGTSLPEFVATLAAALKGKSDVAFGNIIGSNIYNVLGILGITALVTPLRTPADITTIDMSVLVLGAALALIHASRGGRITRIEGMTLLAMYGVYVWYLLARPS